MANTLISDVIVPAVWAPYVINVSTEKTRLVTSGMIERSAEFDAKAAGEGVTVNMPFWNDLDGDDQVLSDSGALSTKKITASQDTAVLAKRGDAWSTNDLAGLIAGSDPAAAIASRVGEYWSRKTQKLALSVLKGVFATAGMAGNKAHIHNTTGAVVAANQFTGVTFLDALQLLGDEKENLGGIIIHSATETSLAKQNLIQYIQPSDGSPRIPTFMGKTVIVDDGMPVETVNTNLVYTTYIFGRGALALGIAAPTNAPVEGGHGTWEVEFSREALAHNSVLINRRRLLLHPRGVKWLGASVAGSSPTNAEYETAANWSRVWDTKQIRLVSFKHNLA